MEDDRRKYNNQERDYFGKRFEDKSIEKDFSRGYSAFSNIPNYRDASNNMQQDPNFIKSQQQGEQNIYQTPNYQSNMGQINQSNTNQPNMQNMGQQNYSNYNPNQLNFKTSNNTYDEIDYDNNSHYSNFQEANKKKKSWFNGWKNKKTHSDQVEEMRNVVITYPKTFSDVQVIIDGLRNGQSMIVDLSKINEKNSQRIMDYLSGAIYALAGSQQQIAENMFLFTPEGVTIQGPTDLKRRFN